MKRFEVFMRLIGSTSKTHGLRLERDNLCAVSFGLWDLEAYMAPNLVPGTLHATYKFVSTLSQNEVKETGLRDCVESDSMYSSVLSKLD
jgi:hypothetical protein